MGEEGWGAGGGGGGGEGVLRAAWARVSEIFANNPNLKKKGAGGSVFFIGGRGRGGGRGGGAAGARISVKFLQTIQI